MRRSQDTINPDFHADVMVLSSRASDSDHPYAYARILRVFHAEVFDHTPHSPSPGPTHTEFLWVRWYDIDTTHQSGFQHRRLPRLQYSTGVGAFGFINPSDIIRSVHLVPAYTYGFNDSAPSSTLARRASDGDQDWRYYYVNM